MNQIEANYSLYYQCVNRRITILLLYVDDLLLTRNNTTYVNNPNDKIYIICFICFKLAGGPITWASKKQRTVATSYIDAKTKAITEDIEPISLFYDHQSTIKSARNPIFHARSKHVEVQHHFICENLLTGTVDLFYISTLDQIADTMTKPLTRGKFLKIQDELGICSLSTIQKH
uniref:Reverse transcriptase Ty1/copia-type domain-containing protein n=1 Tax=Physcomitrium patens TaxID=3218 RepID=A0A2K1L3U8_PHYPA|nr:hypothetical protein PHYPA_003484 [Physcomitrium patens]